MNAEAKSESRLQRWSIYAVVVLVALFFLWVISFATSPTVPFVAFVFAALIIIGHWIDRWAVKIATRVINKDTLKNALLFKVACYAFSAVLWLASTIVLFWVGPVSLILAAYTLLVSTSGVVVEHVIANVMKRPNWIGRMQALYCLFLFALTIGACAYSYIYILVRLTP